LYHAEYRERNRQKLREQNRNTPQAVRDAYNSNRRAKASSNPEYFAAQRKAAYEKHRDRRIEDMREYAKRRPEISRSKSAKRRARSTKAAVPWMKELTDLVLSEAENLKKLRQSSTGVRWAIDHIIPLRGKFVSGLHVFSNFSVIPDKVNRSKLNKFNSDKEFVPWLSY
jgi:hypothetical protein